jgi:hypothetical protein
LKSITIPTSKSRLKVKIALPCIAITVIDMIVKSFKTSTMEQKKQLDAINAEALEKLEAYIKTQTALNDNHHEKINAAKSKWQAAWTEILETLVVLEKLEI